MNAMDTIDRDDAAAFGAEEQYRLPPHNEQAERAVLGAILQSEAVLDRLGDLLTGEDFYHPVHGRIFEAAQQAVASGRRADPVTLRAAFTHDQGLDDAGGVEYLAKLLVAAVPSRVAADYAREIRDTALRRRLIETCQDAADEAWATPGGEDMAERLEGELYGLRTRSGGEDGTSSLDAYDAMLRDAQAIANGEIPLVATGFQGLDDMIYGLAPGDVMVIGGRPAMGKSAIAQAITRHNLAKGSPVGWLQLEMSRAQMLAREASALTGISANRIQMGRLAQWEWDKLIHARAQLGALPLVIDDRAGVHIDAVLPRLRRMVRRKGIKVAVIDYLGLIRFSSRNGRYEGLTEVSGRLKEAARALGIPLIVLHQLSRATEKRGDIGDHAAKRPTLADLRDSGAIEQDADKVLFVHRPEYYLARIEPERDDIEEHMAWEREMAKVAGTAELILAKHRQGETGTARCLFEGHTTTFKDAAERELI